MQSVGFPQRRAASDRCQTCRTRRIKCDGLRPSCKNCCARGWTCPGYSIWTLDVRTSSGSDFPHNIPPTSTSAQPTLDTIPTALSSSLCNTHIITDEARHAFDYCRYELCARFRARHYPISWATASISLALQEPAVFYALAALSIVDQALPQTVHTTLARPIDASKRDVAIRMYSKALSSLQEPIQNAIKGVGSLEPVILSCVIFVVYELYSGNNLSATRHARFAKSILDERLGRSLNIGHIVSFPMIEEARSSLETLLEAGRDIGERLKMQARSLIRDLPANRSEGMQFCLEHTLSRFLPIESAFQVQLDLLIHKFRAWATMFANLFSSRALISQDLFFLQIRFFNASFTLETCRTNNEGSTDRFADEFSRTVDAAERLLRHRAPISQRQHGDSKGGPVAVEIMQKLSIADSCYSLADKGGSEFHPQTIHPVLHEQAESQAAGVFEFGILPALFTVACKCRASSLRRRAVQLLSEANRWEAINSSEALSKYAEAIVNLEEQQGAVLLGQSSGISDFYADEVPDEARFLDVVVSPAVEGSSSFILSVTKRSLDGRGIQLIEYECDNSGSHHRVLHNEVIQFSSIFNTDNTVGYRRV